MSGLHDLKPDRVIRAFERAGWTTRKKGGGSHVILSKESSPYVLSIPVHKGKPIKYGLIKKLIKYSGLTEDEFLSLYNPDVIRRPTLNSGFSAHHPRGADASRIDDAGILSWRNAAGR